MGLMFEAFHLDGGTGWTRSFLSFPSTKSDRMMTLEILVADAVDPNADTSLAIDRIQVATSPSVLITNGGFDSNFDGWTTEGNVGIYSTLDDLFVGGPVAGTGPTEGEVYALISTAGVPEPASTTLLIWGSLVVGCLRRKLPTR